MKKFLLFVASYIFSVLCLAESDHSQVHAVFKGFLPAWANNPSLKIEPINVGMSGAKLFKVTADRPYVLRISKNEDSSEQWAKMKAIQEMAATARITPKVVYRDEKIRAVVTLFIQDQSFLRHYSNHAEKPRLRHELISQIKLLHSLKIEQATGIDHLQHMKGSWAHVFNDKGLPGFVSEAFKQLSKIQAPQGERVLSHNDINPNNILYDGKTIWLIDWETAGLGHPYFDVATISNFLLIGPEDFTPLNEYLLRKPMAFEISSFKYYRKLSLMFYALSFLGRLKDHQRFHRSQLTLEAAPRLSEAFSMIDKGLISLYTEDGQQLIGLSFAKESTLY